MEIKVGQVIGGGKILRVWTDYTLANRQKRVATFRCGCGQHHTTILSAVTHAYRDNRTLKCAACIRKNKFDADKRSDGSVRAKQSADYCYAPSLATRKLLARLAPDVREYAEKLFRNHMAACLKNKIALEPVDRIWVECVHLAELGRSPLDAGWTAENRREGLQVCSYNQYAVGIGLI